MNEPVDNQLREEQFAKIQKHVLEKNRELLRRLASPEQEQEEKKPDEY